MGLGIHFFFPMPYSACDALYILLWEFTCCTKQHHLGALMQSPHWAQRLKHFTWGRHGHSKERKCSHSDAPRESRSSAVVCKHNCDLYYLQTGSPWEQVWVTSALDIAYPVPSLAPGWWYELRYSVKECLKRPAWRSQECGFWEIQLKQSYLLFQDLFS